MPRSHQNVANTGRVANGAWTMALDDYGGRPYRCRSKRVGGRAASEFMACGETALRLVRGDAL